MKNTPIADCKDQSDDRANRWGRSRHDGFHNFRHGFIQPAPLFFSQDGHPIWLADLYRGASAFLIASGPSFGALDHAPLRKPGIMTFGVNNSVRTFRPNMWCCVDPVDHWIKSTLLDPKIMKFVPLGWANRYVFDSDSWKFTSISVGDCPNVLYFKRNERFQPQQFLFEDCLNWGNHANFGGGRSVLLPAIRILFLLGFRNVYLLGVDFNMSPTTKYHFAQDRNPGSIKGNNETYQKLNQWFSELRPLFEEQDFHVYNCNPESNLKAFAHLPYKEALRRAVSHMPLDLDNERTAGLYNTKTRYKELGLGRELTWEEVKVPRRCDDCRYCGKRCMVAEREDPAPEGQFRMLATCNKSDKWRKIGWSKVRTEYAAKDEVIRMWNERFGKKATVAVDSL